MTRPGDWVVLRCAGASTLRLSDSLAEAGFEVWTPREELRRQIKGKVEWRIEPMLPSFVFARAEKLADLLHLARYPAQTFLVWDPVQRRMVSRGHPFFRVFHIGEEIPLVPDREFVPLRVIESRRGRKPRGKPRQWQLGDRVRLTSGACEGLRGTITGLKGKVAIVAFPGFKQDAILSVFALLPDIDDRPQVHIHTLPPEQRFRAAA